MKDSCDLCNYNCCYKSSVLKRGGRMVKYYFIHILNEISTKINSKKNRTLPKALIQECIKYYEEHDIFLNQDEKYIEERATLLSKNIITHTDFQRFITITRKSPTTYFTYYHSNIFDRIINHLISKDSPKTQVQVPNNTIYIDLDLYQKNVVKRFKRKIAKNRTKSQIIIDLRDKPGGYVQECVKICDMLLPKGSVFSQKYKEKVKTYFTNADRLKFDKVTVLVSRNTASSSEILAQALEKKLPGCTVLGPNTIGKRVGQDHFVNKKYRFIFSVSSFVCKIS